MNKIFLLAVCLLGFAYASDVHAETLTTKVELSLAVAEHSRTIHVEVAGTLSSLIATEELQNLSELKVTGTINQTDIYYIGSTLSESKTPISLDFGAAVLLSEKWSGCRPQCLESIVLPQGITSIENYAFHRCTLLTSIKFPDTVSYIGRQAFYDCRALKVINLPSGLQTIDEQAFGWAGIISITIPGSVKEIGRSAFELSSIQSVTLSEGIASIGMTAFNDCYDLKTINIPSTVTSIGIGAFEDCRNLERVRFANIESLCNIKYADADFSRPTYWAHHIYIGDSEEEVKDVVIPPSVKTIEGNLFANCQSIERVTLHEGVESVADKAFDGCTHLEYVEFAAAKLPKYLGENAIPEQATIVVPDEGYDAYAAHPNLQQHALLGHIVGGKERLFQTVDAEARMVGSSLLDTMDEVGMASVYDLTLRGSINGYDLMMLRNKMPNLRHLDLTDVEIVDNPYEYYEGCHSENHRLGANAFRDMKNLVSVRLPKSITTIDRYAFAGCTGLREVVFQPGLVTIGDHAFDSCTSLLAVDLPVGVKTIGNSAFRECENIERLMLGEGLLSIGNGAFALIFGLQSVVLPSTIEFLGDRAFHNCMNLQEVVLPTRLREIREGTFGYCYALECVHIPPMVEIIADEAFVYDVLNDVYVYVANPKDIDLAQGAFTNWRKTTLHVPSFGRNAYFSHPQWGQFARLESFDEPYETFYTRNTITLDQSTGIIDGTPDALLYEHGSLVVNDGEVQPLGDVTLTHDGKDGASLIPEQTDAITVETLNVDINVSANRWHFFAFPFDVDLASITYEGDSKWMRYDGARRSRGVTGWTDLDDDTTLLKAGRGYAFQGTKAGVLHFTVNHPQLVADNVSAELKTHATADTRPADASWNFIGNPYTSYYAVDEATYAAPITIWTGRGYEAYRPGDDDYEFAPYEAFFVQVPTGTNAVDFSADNREGYEQAQETQSNRRMARAQKKVNPNRLLVNLELGVQGDPSTSSGTSKYLDKTRIVFNDECSLDYESDCDAAKFFAGQSGLGAERFSDERRAELYTIGTDGTQYAINERPEDGGYVELGFVANQKGKYTISAQRMDVPMLLIDDVMETTFDLRNGAYEFSSAKGTFNKRFYLKRYEGITTSIKDLADQIGMSFSISDGSISVEGLDAATRVSLYNTAGQQVATQQGNGTLTIQRQPASGPGTYVITVGKLAAKVVVKK